MFESLAARSQRRIGDQADCWDVVLGSRRTSWLVRFSGFPSEGRKSWSWVQLCVIIMSLDAPMIVLPVHSAGRSCTVAHTQPPSGAEHSYYMSVALFNRDTCCVTSEVANQSMTTHLAAQPTRGIVSTCDYRMSQPIRLTSGTIRAAIASGNQPTHLCR